MKVESICIVGGGSAGWMSAALLAKQFPDIEIALVESDKKPTIGVGESTLGHFNRYLLHMELEDEDWMPHCNATYKTSIAFRNFKHGKGERFQYPFGGLAYQEPYRTDIQRFYELQILHPELYPDDEFARFWNPSTLLTEQQKIAKTGIDGMMWDHNNDSAYHFDAELFGIYLKEHHCQRVQHVVGHVDHVVKTEDGYIKAIVTAEGSYIEADMYVDCTGFKSLLLEGFMGSEWESFKDVLFNDRAVATQIPYKNRETEMDTYTDCDAQSAGWVWNIPLWNRVGTGYVYSSDYINPCEAEVEFRKYLSERYSPEIAQNAEMRHIKIKHGKHKEAWVKNVVGIGLSYGFLEPLESTGLMTTHENILFFANALARRNGLLTDVDRKSFNFTVDKVLENMKLFVAQHYYLTQRQDNKYWRDVTNIELGHGEWRLGTEYSTLQSKQEYYNLLDRATNKFYDGDTFGGLLYISAGQGYRPISSWDFKVRCKNVPMHYGQVTSTHEWYQKEKQRLLDIIEDMPTHYEYLRDRIYGEETVD